MGKLEGKDDKRGAEDPQRDRTLRGVDDALDTVDDAMAEVEGPVDDIATEVQQLAWALVDDYLDEPGLRRLEQLVLTSDVARTTYIKCIQLHVDLIYYFAEQRRKEDPNAGPPFPLPAELQKLLQQGDRQSPGKSDGPAQCRALRRPSALARWRRALNNWADDLAASWAWHFRMMFSRI